MRYYKFILIGLLLLIFLPYQNWAQNGAIKGKVIDAQTQAPLIGANILIKDKAKGTSTNLKGEYIIKNIPPGNYKLRAQHISYNKKKIKGVRIEANDTVKLTIKLQPNAVEMDAVTVEARQTEDNEKAILKLQKKSGNIQDGISAERISKVGAGDAGEAIKKVSGASLSDGKNINVRGLSGRYVNVELNNTNVPSLDPDKKSAQMDIFPTELLDNVTVVKTFSPDMSGNFTGGKANLSTKNYPDEPIFKISIGSSYNPHNHLHKQFLTYEGSKTDWLGYDNGKRELPSSLKVDNAEPPSLTSSLLNNNSAKELDRYSKKFSKPMRPEKGQSYLDHDFSLTGGNTYNIGSHELGIIGAITYARNLKSYQNGKVGRYILTDQTKTTDSLTPNLLLNDHKSTDNAKWSGLINVAYRFNRHHDITLTAMNNHSGTSTARFLQGKYPENFGSNFTYQTSVLGYKERKVRSLQFKGQHEFPALSNLEVNWKFGTIASQQNEPDLRYFTNHYTVRNNNNTQDTLYQISPSIYPVPTHYYRTLYQINRNGSIDFNLPLKDFTPFKEGKLKMGAQGIWKQRTFTEDRFSIYQHNARYNGRPHQFFASQNMGLINDPQESVINRFGNYVNKTSKKSNNYSGQQSILATYAMVDLHILKKLRVIGGLRLEHTNMYVASEDTSLQPGKLDNNDLLPSFNLVYELSSNMNVRGSYSRTLARPSFREIAPYASFDFVGGAIEVGNSNLERTLIDNFDLRWEWYPNPGEIVAASAYYKNFTNPIERVINPNVGGSEPEINYKNVKQAKVYGIEVEGRKKLAPLGTIFKNLKIGGNIALIHSQVDIARKQLESIRALNATAESTRPFQYQSPYLINANLTYNNESKGTELGLYYNVFGPRLKVVSIGATPNVYEQPRHKLNFNYKQKVSKHFYFSLKVENILNAQYQSLYEFKNTTYTYRQHTIGRSFSLSLSYQY